MKADQRKITIQDTFQEPFRIFFPAAILAGLMGVFLWPLHFSGVLEWYPGVGHARLMAHGFFGGFIFGFLGTSLPRLLSAKPFTGMEIALYLFIYASFLAAHTAGATWLGDLLFFILLLGYICSAGSRFVSRKDLPPPGFVLVGLAFLCALSGAVISLLEPYLESAFFWFALKPLLYYQGFVLLPILGVGGFILPRFFGLPNRQEFPESLKPPPGWTKKSLEALAVGLIIVGSFLAEALGYPRLGHAVRLLAASAYLLREVPFYRANTRGQSLAFALKIAFALFFAGILTIFLFPEYRVALLHLTLIGGFGIITLTVGTRVLLGHSGNQQLLRNRLRWLTISVVLMVLGMATRISGDFWPAILASHYNYGAIIWSAGALVWAAYALPKVLITEK